MRLCRVVYSLQQCQNKYLVRSVVALPLTSRSHETTEEKGILDLQSIFLHGSAVFESVLSTYSGVITTRLDPTYLLLMVEGELKRPT